MGSLIACPGCQHKLTMPDDFAGRRVRCPMCALDFTAPVPGVPSMEVELGEKSQTAPPTTSVGAEPSVPSNVPRTAYERSDVVKRRTTASSSNPSIYCQECGTNYPRGDDVCPACGYSGLDEAIARQGRHGRFRRLTPISGLLPILGVILFLLGLAFCVVGPIVYGSVPRRMRWVGELATAVGCTAGGLAVIGALVCITAWLYQAWRLVLSEDEEYSPGLMVGLLFIPFFNLYWIFRAIPGLSLAIQNELCQLAPARSHNAGWVVGLLACIFVLIPYFQPVAFCLFVAWMLLANNAIQRLLRYHERLREEGQHEGAQTSALPSGPRHD